MGSFIPATLSSSYTYTIGDPTLSISFDPYTTTDNCVDVFFIYTSTLTNGDPLPSCITFLGAFRTFNIYSTDPTKAGTYDIRIVATDNVGLQETTLTYSLTVIYVPPPTPPPPTPTPIPTPIPEPTPEPITPPPENVIITPNTPPYFVNSLID